MSPTDVRADLRENAAIATALGVVAILMAVDLALDLGRGAGPFHTAVEGAAILAATLGVALIARRLRLLTHQAQALRAQARELASSLAATQRDAERWRQEARAFIAGLGAAIEQQLVRWGLTAAEKEVALLLLKGLEHKEIAELRGVGETTVRQQARSVYRKGGLTGRHDLAAFFLEDLLDPRPASAPGDASRGIAT